MLDAVMAAAFEHMQEARDVGVDISVGVVKGVAHAGLGREVDDAVGLLLGEYRLDDLAFGQIRLDEAEAVPAP